MQRAISRSLSNLLNVEIRSKGRVAIISFNTPNNLNALTLDMGISLQKEVATLSKMKDLRCAILTGKGRAFSAGGDLAFLKDRYT
jgi:enoyl-CoA hydratase